MNEISPVLLFTYNRIEELKKTIANLKRAELSRETVLYVFSDGPKSDNDIQSVENVRGFLKSIEGFKEIIYKFSESNRGLASSIIHGVTEIIELHERVIVLEDDLLVSENFLVYMNKGLDYYSNHNNILSVCGYSSTISKRKSDEYPYDIFFAKRTSSWGWATWKDKWKNIDWEIKDFKDFSKNKKEIKEFNKWGSDMYSMLKRQQMRKVDSWAIRYCYHQYKNNLWSVFPLVSKIKNIGFNNSATNTKEIYNRYEVDLDESCQSKFDFMNVVKLNHDIVSEFIKLNSLGSRIKYKILNLISDTGLRNNKSK